jgi:light-regulated signal transduction histidine kinase (bacteriophytochrome)
MLRFAGIQSGRKVYDPQPTDVTDIAERFLADYAVHFAGDGWQIEQHFAEDLSLVLTDGPALESALKNLFENALRYAAPGNWLSVSACAALYNPTVIEIPQDSNLTESDRQAIRPFEPVNIPPAGAPGGTPVVTQPAQTQPRKKNPNE